MRRSLAVVVGCVSVFFIFYTVRLYAVTRGLQTVRVGGQGAYIGAVVFPILAIAFGWFAWRLWQRNAAPSSTTQHQKERGNSTRLVLRSTPSESSR
jgi:membrane protein implicated in regulation of membrane protease activity